MNMAQQAEQPQKQPQEYTGYSIKTPLFEGPLDLLLYLVRNYEINIYDIPITMITEQFTNYLKLLKKLDLEIASEFIVMVAHLMLIKSKMLLPIEPEMDDDEEDPRNELVQQLLEYQRFKQAATILEEKETLNSEILERRPGQMTLEFPEDEGNWLDVKLFDLVNAFSRLISKHETEEPAYPVLADIEEHYDPEEKIQQITSILIIREQVLFSEIISDSMPHGEIIVSFLAILHMIKRNFISVKQHRLFGDIQLFAQPQLEKLAAEENMGTVADNTQPPSLEPEQHNGEASDPDNEGMKHTYKKRRTSGDTHEQ